MKTLLGKSLSARASLIGAALSLIALVVFIPYGIIYDYFDGGVLLALAIGTAFATAYALWDNPVAELFNVLAILFVTYGMGLFFLNSYPVWADRLNNITMYGSRGTLFPVVTIMLLCIASSVAGIVSCWTRKGVTKS